MRVVVAEDHHAEGGLGAAVLACDVNPCDDTVAAIAAAGGRAQGTHTDITEMASCTAMAEPAMQKLLQWLQPQAHPVFALLPQAEQARLAAPWQLPAP